MVKWLRDSISHWFGWETYEEALARIHAEIERDYPLDQLRAESKLRILQAAVALEELRKRLDNGGEYERGIEGMQ